MVSMSFVESLFHGVVLLYSCPDNKCSEIEATEEASNEED